MSFQIQHFDTYSGIIFREEGTGRSDYIQRWFDDGGITNDITNTQYGDWILPTLDGDLHLLQTGVCIDDSAHWTHPTRSNQYLSFTTTFNVFPSFPVSELILCYFVVFLVRQVITPFTIYTLLAAIHPAQITRDLPVPDKRQGSIPWL